MYFSMRSYGIIQQGSLLYSYLLETPVGNRNWSRVEGKFMDEFLFDSTKYTMEDGTV